MDSHLQVTSLELQQAKNLCRMLSEHAPITQQRRFYISALNFAEIISFQHDADAIKLLDYVIHKQPAIVTSITGHRQFCVYDLYHSTSWLLPAAEEPQQTDIITIATSLPSLTDCLKAIYMEQIESDLEDAISAWTYQSIPQLQQSA